MRPLIADSKGRITLGKIYAGQIFQATKCDGALVIEQAALIPERERWLYNNPEALQKVQKGIADARAGKLTKNAIDLDKDFDEFDIR